MKKESYRTDIPKEPRPAKNGDAPIVMRENDTASEGANGFNALEMGIEGFGQDSDKYDTPADKIKSDSRPIGDVINLLVELGDASDETGNEIFADFTDYLLVKFAETKEGDPTLLFNQLMIKIANADIPDTNDIIKKLTKIYSRTILLEHSKHHNIDEAKKSAYKKVVHRADQYMSET